MAFWRGKNKDGAGTPLPPTQPASAKPQPSAASSAPPDAGNPGIAPPAKRPAAAPAAPAKPAPLDAEQLKQRAGQAKEIAAAFGQIVSVLMRSEALRTRTLADLEWMVVPAVMSGQYSIAEVQSKQNGMSAPLAVALWASVSAAVDQRLSESIAEPIQLKPEEWRSGEILWLVEAVGEARALGAVLQQLGATRFKGKPVKLRAKDKDGRATLGVIGGAVPVANGAKG